MQKLTPLKGRNFQWLLNISTNMEIPITADIAFGSSLTPLVNKIKTRKISRADVEKIDIFVNFYTMKRLKKL